MIKTCIFSLFFITTLVFFFWEILVVIHDRGAQGTCGHVWECTSLAALLSFSYLAIIFLFLCSHTCTASSISNSSSNDDNFSSSSSRVHRVLVVLWTVGTAVGTAIFDVWILVIFFNLMAPDCTTYYSKNHPELWLLFRTLVWLTVASFFLALLPLGKLVVDLTYLEFHKQKALETTEAGETQEVLRGFHVEE